MKHKIVFLDMDGTLYQTENDIIQPSSLEVIEKLKADGTIVCAATGRPLHQMNLILKRVQFDYYVLINGAYVLDGQFEEIGATNIQRQSVDDLIQLCQSNQFGLMFHFGDCTYIYNEFYPMYDFCKYCNVLDSLFYDPSQSHHKRHRVLDAVVMTKDKAKMDAFMAEHPDLRSDLINVKSDGFMFDIFPASVDKTTGIQMVLDKEGLTWQDVIAFGDSTNDIHMLEKAGIGVAMGSASDYVKSFANFATTSTYENGIANGFKKIWLDQEKS